jgi:hypothetical protein
MSRCFAALLSLALLAGGARAQEDEPAVQVDDQGLVTATFDGVPLAEALVAIADAADVSIVLPASTFEWVDLRVTARLRGIPLGKAFAALLAAHGIKSEVGEDGHAVLVMFPAEQALELARLELQQAQIAASRAELEAEVAQRELEQRGEEEDEDEDEADEDDDDDDMDADDDEDGDREDDWDEDEDEDRGGVIRPRAEEHAHAPSAEQREEAKLLVAQAQASARSNDFLGAIQTLGEAIEADPTCAPAWYERGRSRMRTGEFVPGVLDLSKALQLDPAYGDPIFNQAAQISNVVDLDTLKPQLDAVVAEQPREAHVVFLRALFGALRLELKGHDDAVARATFEDLERTLQLDRDHATARLVLARLRAKDALRSPDEARELLHLAHRDIERVLERHPDLPVAHILKGMVLSIASAHPDTDEEQRGALRLAALAALRRAKELGIPRFADRLRNERGFDAIKDDPAFQELLRG